jgi:hypothetical protein
MTFLKASSSPAAEWEEPLGQRSRDQGKDMRWGRGGGSGSCLHIFTAEPGLPPELSSSWGPLLWENTPPICTALSLARATTFLGSQPPVVDCSSQMKFGPTTHHQPAHHNRPWFFQDTQQSLSDHVFQLGHLNLISCRLGGPGWKVKVEALHVPGPHCHSGCPF